MHPVQDLQVRLEIYWWCGWHVVTKSGIKFTKNTVQYSSIHHESTQSHRPGPTCAKSI